MRTNRSFTGLPQKALKIGERHIRELTICKKSVDCRKKDDIKFIFSVDVALDIDEKRVASKAKQQGFVKREKAFIPCRP